MKYKYMGENEQLRGRIFLKITQKLWTRKDEAVYEDVEVKLQYILPCNEMQEIGGNDESRRNVNEAQEWRRPINIIN